MNEIDKAYLAGLFDGDGCVSIVKYNAKKSASPVYQLHVSIYQNNEGFLKGLCDLVRLGKVYLGKVPKNNWGASYDWRITGAQAEIFLSIIRDYSRIKQDQIDIALKFRSTFPAYNGNRPMFYRVLDLRENFRITLQDLKKTKATP